MKPFWTQLSPPTPNATQLAQPSASSLTLSITNATHATPTVKPALPLPLHASPAILETGGEITSAILLVPTEASCTETTALTVIPNAHSAAHRRPIAQLAAVQHICSTRPAILHVPTHTSTITMEEWALTFVFLVTPSAPHAQVPQALTAIPVPPPSR
jgi:hypothetical protein